MAQRSVDKAPRSSRRFSIAVIGFALAAVLLDARPAVAATPAEAFLQQSADAGVKILQDKTTSADQRHQKLREFLLSIMDVKRIALFTLGQWRQTASDADRDAFVDAFRDFMVANYSSMVGDYGGQTLKVTESVARNENDYVVTAQVVDPSNASNNSPPSQVQVRVLNESGKFVVVDASVEGVWLGLAQREDFTSFLKQQNGDLAALTERVRGLAEKLKSAK